MSEKTPFKKGSRDGYWEKRIRSTAFKRELTAVVEQEIAWVSGQRIKDVVDADLVRSVIQGWDAKMIDRAFLADLLVQGNRTVARTLRRRGKSLLGLLDTELAAGIDALLEEDMPLSRYAEDFAEKIMRQEFVRRLFTDIIFTSIVSFYEKVNPFFGAIAMRALEDQIKGFIRLFMPMIQSQATAFAINKGNQRILLDFTRSIIRQLLDEPLEHYAAMVSSGQRKKAATLVRQAVDDAKLGALMRTVALALWDDLYARVGDKQVGDLLRLEEHAGWLAARSVEVILPVLLRPHMIRFIAAESARAGTQHPKALPP
jgi:hypothetical protein